MAENTLLIQFQWENNNHFTMTSKLNVEDAVEIVRMGENACLDKLWPDIKSIAMKYIEAEVDIIGNEMKA